MFICSWLSKVNNLAYHLMSNLNKPEITKAFEHVQLLCDDDQDEQINKYLSFKGGHRKNQKAQKQENYQTHNLLVNMQALQTKQVDHNIEEIGIMAVRQVKYISQKEWLKLVKMRQKQYQMLDKIRSLSSNAKNQMRQENVMKRIRNQKGQFVTTQKKKPIQKEKSNRGRKPKRQSLAESYEVMGQQQK